MNNAGTNVRTPTADYALEDYEKVISTNMHSVFHVTQVGSGTLQAVPPVHSASDGVPEDWGLPAMACSLETSVHFVWDKSGVSIWRPDTVEQFWGCCRVEVSVVKPLRASGVASFQLWHLVIFQLDVHMRATESSAKEKSLPWQPHELQRSLSLHLHDTLILDLVDIACVLLCMKKTKCRLSCRASGPGK